MTFQRQLVNLPTCWSTRQVGTAQGEHCAIIQFGCHDESVLAEGLPNNGSGNTRGQQDSITPLMAVSKSLVTIRRYWDVLGRVSTLLEEPNIMSEADVLNDRGQEVSAVGRTDAALHVPRYIPQFQAVPKSLETASLL